MPRRASVDAGARRRGTSRRGPAPTRGSSRSRTGRRARRSSATAPRSAARSPRSWWVMRGVGQRHREAVRVVDRPGRAIASWQLARAAVVVGPSSQCACADQAAACTSGRVPTLTEAPCGDRRRGQPKCRSASAGLPRLTADPPTREVRRAAQLGARARRAPRARVAVRTRRRSGPGRTATTTARPGREQRVRAAERSASAIDRSSTPCSSRGGVAVPRVERRRHRLQDGQLLAVAVASRRLGRADGQRLGVQPDRLGVGEHGRPPPRPRAGSRRRPARGARRGRTARPAARPPGRCRRRAAAPGPGRGGGAAASAAAG